VDVQCYNQLRKRISELRVMMQASSKHLNNGISFSVIRSNARENMGVPRRTHFLIAQIYYYQKFPYATACAYSRRPTDHSAIALHVISQTINVSNAICYHALRLAFTCKIGKWHAPRLYDERSASVSTPVQSRSSHRFSSPTYLSMLTYKQYPIRNL
jgi:hypothetical protein